MLRYLMTKAEQGCGRDIGRLGKFAGERIYDLVRVEGRQYLETADAVLEAGGSLLLIGNHPDLLTTIYSYGIVMDLDHRNPDQTVLLASSKYFDGRLGIWGDLAMNVAATSDIEALKIIQFYEQDKETEKAEANGKAAMRAMAALKSPGGIVWVYPEGTRSKERMIEAQPGIASLVSQADLVVSVVSPYSRRPFPKIKVLPLVNGKFLMRQLSAQFGRAAAKETIIDVLMTGIALNLPPDNRGAYTLFAGVIEGWVKADDEQTQNLISAWKWLEISQQYLNSSDYLSEY